MAITVTTDMLYTRPGAAESDVLSAHDPLIWEWLESDGAIDSATVQFVVKDNLIAVIYTSDVFPAYLYDDSGPVLFRFDATQIIKHIIENYFYKETSEVIEPENYGSFIEVTIKTYDGVSLEDTEVLEYFACHALNQIGDEYGSNIPRLFYNDTEEIAHFLGFPNHLFFYSPDDLSAHEPYLEIISRGIIESANKISAWDTGGSAYETFTVTGTAVDSAIETGTNGQTKTVTTFPVVVGENYAIIIPALVLNSGQLPEFFLRDTGFAPACSNSRRAAVGDNVLVVTVDTARATASLLVKNDAAANWSCGIIQVKPVESASGQGSLLKFMHDINLGLMQLTVNSILAKIYYDLDTVILIKTYNLTIFQPCNNSVYIRFLTKDGYYMYWAFSPFPTTSQQSDDIGKVINSFSEMALANSRHFPIGKRDAFKRLSVASASVPKVFRRKLMDLFTSPAVYLWQGQETPNENLITEWINSNYDTTVTSDTVMISMINIAGAADVSNNTPFGVNQGEQIIVIFDLVVNSGETPRVRLVTTPGGVNISNTAISAAGFNALILTVTVDDENVRIVFSNTAASNFSTGKIIVKRAEVETDWILLEGVEGSHNLREKKDFDNFNATLVLPEKYTQTLSGQNL